MFAVSNAPFRPFSTDDLLRTRRSALQHLLDPFNLAVLEGGFKDGDHITAVMKVESGV
jgi:hypothetical protein